MGAVRTPMIVVAWLCATAAAVGVSWLGVRTVVHDAVLMPPQLAVPASPVRTGTPPPTPPATSVLPTTPSSVPPATTTSPAATTTTRAASTPTPTTTAKPPVNTNVHSYSVKGGQVVLSLSSTSATLVSATPADGYSVQVWQEDGWLRVDFSSSGGTSSVFATWNGHPPSVQTYET
jgi:hypothetical protein